MACGLHNLELTGLQVKTILSVHIHHKPGEHGVMELTADLGEENGEFPIHETGSGQKIALYQNENGKRDFVFCGVIVGLEVCSVGKSYHVKVRAYTNSYLMDIKKKSRSFQDTSMTMGALISGIVREYSGVSQILFDDKAIGEIAVQYEETDWQFMKRMLSAWHVPVVCSEVREEICLYMGAAQIPGNLETISVEKVWKDMDELSYWKEAGVGISDEEFIAYQLKLDNHIPLYSSVSYRGRELVVSELHYQTIGSTVYEFVTLKKKAGILQKTIYPMELVGSALEGTILNVKGEKVQIHLKIDDAFPGKDCYWFPYSTPSASSDGSGWYCMPEKGDKVRIYFPSKKTGEVIAISAVSTYHPSSAQSAGQSNGDAAASGGNFEGGGGGNSSGGISSSGGASAGSVAGGAAGLAAAGKAAGASADGAGKDEMSDPATKYLKVPSGQQIKLSPAGIIILCSGDSVRIEILKNGRISITAREGIQISAQNNFKLNAKYSMKMQCEETAYLKSQMGGSIYMDDEGKLTIQGTEVHVN